MQPDPPAESGNTGARTPLVSIIIPTLNSARALEDCLASVAAQDLHDGAVEVVVADGGSTDGSRQIAERYGATIVDNPLQTGEAGKAAALRVARGTLACFVDSDNILVGTDWLHRMLRPFEDPEIVASEPIRYSYRPSDNYLTRYFAQIGMNDPLCLFLGNYDRTCLLSGKWTGLQVKSVQRPGYEKVWCSPRAMPTIGANGFLVRVGPLRDLATGDYLFDVDAARALLERGERAVAKVDCSIVHVCAMDVRSYRRKQRRRIRDYLHYARSRTSVRGQQTISKHLIVKFVSATALGWPVVAQAILGLVRSRDSAWLFHPAACSFTLFEYGLAVLTRRWQAPLSRAGWSQ